MGMKPRPKPSAPPVDDRWPNGRKSGNVGSKPRHFWAMREHSKTCVWTSSHQQGTERPIQDTLLSISHTNFLRLFGVRAPTRPAKIMVWAELANDVRSEPETLDVAVTAAPKKGV